MLSINDHFIICLSQTDIDAIMMEKNALCVGPMYGYSSWKNYWEGTLKRENESWNGINPNVWCNGQLWHYQ